MHACAACAQVGGVVLGGSGLFRTDGKTHYGARKLIAGIAGIEYDSGEYGSWACTYNGARKLIA